MKKNVYSGSRPVHGGRLRKWFSGFLAVTTAVSMLGGGTGMTLAEEPSTGQAFAEEQSTGQTIAEEQSTVQNQAEDQSTVQTIVEEQGTVQNQAEDQSTVQNQADEQSTGQTIVKEQSTVQNQTDEQSTGQAIAQEQSAGQALVKDQSTVQNQADEQSTGQTIVKEQSTVQNQADEQSTGQALVDEQSVVQNQADEQSTGQTIADELPSGYALAGAGSGHDVTVHFGNGENQDINIHINPETSAEAEGETLAGAFSQTVPDTETEAGVETETETETEADTERILEAETEEETETEAGTEEAKKEYVYDDDKVHVTAILEKPDAIPSGALFQVTEVTPDSDAYNYDAYMEALNESGTRSASQTYNQSNTILYDIAFIVPEYDENGKPIDGTGVEYEPAEGSVSISIDFKSNQLSEGISASENEDVSILHLPVSESAMEGVATTSDATDISAADISVETVEADVNVDGQESADFEVNHFSVYAAVNNRQDNAIRMRIVFQDHNGNLLNEAPDLSQSRLYMYVRDTNNSNHYLQELTKDGAEYSGTISGLLDQNGNMNNGALFSFDPDHGYEMTLFSYGSNSYTDHKVDTDNANGKLFLKNGMLLASRYILNLGEQLSGRKDTVSPGHEYIAVATALGPAGAETFSSILGDAVNFGIVTEHFYQAGGDAQTNVATYKGRCSTQTGNDLTNSVEQTFILAEIEEEFKIKGYGVYVKVPSGDESKLERLEISDNRYIIIDTSQTKEQLKKEVKEMLDYTKDQSDALMSRKSNARIEYNQGDQKYYVDLTGRGPGTYYIAVSDEMYGNIMSQADKLRIKKADNQTIVFNIAHSGQIGMQKFTVLTDGAEKGSDSLLDVADPVTQTVIWNMPHASQVSVNGSITGVVLAHNAEILLGATSSGWLISKKVSVGAGEWHNVYRHVEKLSDAVILRAAKTINHEASFVSGFTFSLEYKQGNAWTPAGTTTNAQSAISFSDKPCLEYSDETFIQTGTDSNGKMIGEYYYRITETEGDTDSLGNHYLRDSSSYYAKVTVAKIQVKKYVSKDRHEVLNAYSASAPQYFKDEKCTQPIAENTVPTFNNISLVTTEIPVLKTWQDKNNAHNYRPKKITLKLLADGEICRTADVKPADDSNNWSYTFTELPKYRNDNGTVHRIEYTVEEEPVEHYYVTVNEVEKDSDGNTLSIKLINTERNESGYTIPATGGEGTRRIYLAGLMLIALAGAGLVMLRRRKMYFR